MQTTGTDAARQARLSEIGRALVARLDLEGVIEILLGAARELSGARYAALGILSERGNELERFLTLGIDDETRAAIGDLPRGGGVLGELIGATEPLRLAELGSHPSSCGLPPGHPQMHTFLGVPIRIRGAAWGNLYLTEKAGGAEFDEGDEATILALAGWAAIAVENARLYEGLSRRRNEVELKRDQAERSAQALEVMTDIARSVGGETDVDRILGLIVDRGRTLVQARALLIMLAEGEELVMAATAGELEADLRGVRISIAGTLPGEVLRSGRAERLGDGGSDGEQLAGLGAAAHEEHERLLGLLTEIELASERGEAARVITLVEEVRRLAQAHFSYEQSALFPHLTETVGSPYIAELQAAQGSVVEALVRIEELAGPATVRESAAAETRRLLRSARHSVVSCDALCEVMERQSEEVALAALATREHALTANGA